MRNVFVLMLFLFAIGVWLIATQAAAGCTGGNTCTIDVPVTAEVAHPIASTCKAAARRSVGVAAKAAAVPARAVAKTVKAIRQREHKLVARSVAKVSRATGRLIFHRR